MLQAVRAASRATTRSRGITTCGSTPTRSGPTASSCSPSHRAGPGLHAAADRLPGQRGGLRRRAAARCEDPRAQPPAPGERPAGAVGARRGPREPPALLRPPGLSRRPRSGPRQVESTGQDLRLVIPIQEGPRQRVVKLELPGGRRRSTSARCARACRSRRGAGSTPSSWTARLDTLRAAYAAQGYTQAQVSARQDWNPDHTLVDVTIEVARRAAARWSDRIIVRGNQRTAGRT